MLRACRGFKFEVYPGKNLLLAGDPNTILKPFKFGELDQNSGAQVQLLDQMVQRATGSIDGTSLARQGAGGEARTGAVSMAMAPIVKRNKRTLMRYVDQFLAPAIRKLLWRYMQYDTERYIPVNMTFNVSSTMGIMQREYETINLTQMLSAMQPGTSEHLHILMGLVSNSGMQNRDKVLASLKQKLEQVLAREAAPPVDPNAEQPLDPVALEMARADAIAELQLKYAKIQNLNAESAKLMAQADYERLKPQLEARELALRGIYQTAEDRVNAEFDRRMKLADVLIQKQGIESRERIADKQIVAAQANEPKAVMAPSPVGVGL